MAIELTRNQVLDLMKDLQPNHWFQETLLVELNELTSAPSIAKVIEPNSVLSIHKTDRVHTPVVVNHVSENGHAQCKWQTYGYRCTNKSEQDFCEEHRRVCRESGCDNMANHGCPCEMQFVCGAALCSNHSSCSDHYRR